MMSANPFIYFGGDSFMAGDELADDTLQCWKDMFGRYQAVPDARFFPEFYKAKQKEMHGWSDSQHEEHMRCQRDRHWTSIVCDKHRIKYHNDGAGASSQEAVLHRAVISFDKFEQAGNVPTLAIIHLTDPGRITTYNDMADARTRRLFRNAFDFTYIIDQVLKNSHLMGERAGEINQHYRYHLHARTFVLAHMDVESETGNIIRWMNTLAITNSFFKEKTGRYPIYVSSWGGALTHYTQYLGPTSKNESSSPEYQSLIHQARLYTIDSNVWNLGHEPHLLCPGGHHTPQTHANFAQFIAPHLLQELNNVS